VIRPARNATAVLALAPIAAYLWIALHRVGYPYELDWMEGGSVELAARVAAGHTLYAAPSLAFTGWTYTPLYYLVSAAVGSVIGIGFAALRLVSLIASLGVMATLGWIVARETGDRIAGLLAAGLFAATFRISGSWLDMGRVDSLFVALTMLTLARGRWTDSRRGGIALGALAFLAFFTKQSALMAVAPALLVLAVARPRAGLSALVTLAALLVVSTFALDAATGGWYRYYVLDELAGQPWSQQTWLGFWRADLWRHLWPEILLLAAAAIVMARRWWAGGPPPGWFPLAYQGASIAGLIGAAWVSRLHVGGYLNVLIPAYAAVALGAGLAYGGLVGAGRGVAAVLALAAVAVQMATLAYPIAAQIPTAADRTAGRELISRLRTLPGPVLVLRHPWYATELGKGAFAQAEALGDVLRSADPRGAGVLRASLPGALDADHVQAVVLDGSFDAHFLEPALSREFRRVRGPVTATPLYPLTDVHTAPMVLYVRAGT
jgi:hypothetical protein